MVRSRQQPVSDTVLDEFPIEIIPLDQLRPHPKNYRVHTDEQLDEIEASIREHGYYRNVIIAEDGTMLAGHGVLETATRMGLPSLPVRRLPLHPDSPAALKVMIGDNELGNLAAVDDRALTEMLREIKDAGESLSGTGFTDELLAALLLTTRPAREIQDKDHAGEWVGMPDFGATPIIPELTIKFDSEQERLEFFQQVMGGKTVNKIAGPVWVVWWPERDREDIQSVHYTGDLPTGLDAAGESYGAAVPLEDAAV